MTLCDYAVSNIQTEMQSLESEWQQHYVWCLFSFLCVSASAQLQYLYLMALVFTAWFCLTSESRYFTGTKKNWQWPGGRGIPLSGVTANTEVALQKRVIGGDECERQYHVQLRAVYPHGPSSLCGGSLISDRWILQLTVWSQEGEEIRAATKTCFCYSVKSKIHSDKMRNRIWWPSVIMFYVCCAHAGPCLQI